MNAHTRIRIFPTGMRLHEWIAFEGGYLGMGREMHVTEFDRLALSLA